MKLFNFILIVFFIQTANSQTYKIDYKSIVNGKNFPITLFSDENQALSIIHYSEGNLTVYPKDFYLKISKTDSILLKNGDFIYYIDNKKNKIYSDNTIFNKGRYWVEEDIYNINWKEIQDYDDFQKTSLLSTSIGEFMGRKYHVVYDCSIKNINGPLKFQGIPGLITEIKSIDDNYISLSKQNIDSIYVNWELIKEQIKKLKPKPTHISVYTTKLNKELSKNIDYLSQIKTIEDLKIYKNFPIKINSLETSYFKEYNNLWDNEISRINKMIELQTKNQIKK